MRIIWLKKWRLQLFGIFVAQIFAAVFPCKTLYAAEEIILQLRWRHQFQFAGYYAAVEKGFYEKIGLKVKLVQGGVNRDTVGEVISGRAQYGVTNSEILLHYLNGKPLVVLAAIFQHSPLVLIARQETGIAHPQQLIGRTIKMTRHSRDVELHAMFHNEGIGLYQLNLVTEKTPQEDYFNPDIHALSAYLTNEPFFWEQKNIPYTTIKPITYGIDFYGDCLFTTKQEIAEHPDRVAAFRQATLNGWAYAMTHVDEIVDLILRRYPQIQKTREHLLYEARTMHDLILPDLVTIGHMNTGRWQHIAQTFKHFGMISLEKPDLSQFIYNPDIQGINQWLRQHVVAVTATAATLMCIIAMLAIFNHRLRREMSERKASEAALLQNRERYLELFQNIGSGVAVYEAVDDGADFVFKDFNRAGEKIENIGKHKLIAHRVSKIFPGIKKMELFKIFKRVWQTGDAEYLPAALYADDQTPATWRENYVYKLSTGEIVAVFNDITKMKHSQIELEQSEQRYRALFENSPISIWEVDFSKAKAHLQALPCDTEEAFQHYFDNSPESLRAVLKHVRVIDINQVTLELYEADSKEELLNQLHNIMPIEDSLDIIKTEIISIALGQMFNIECDNWTLNNRKIHVSIRSSVPPEREADWNRVYISVHDLTDRDMAEKEKHQLESQLRQAQKMEALGTLAGGIAHDFNNILVAIIGYAELALMDTRENSEMADKLKHIRQAGDRASKLVRQILAFSRKSEQLALPIQLSPILNEALRLLRSSLPANIEITTRISDKLDDILGDPTQIHQIILNICTNAGQSLEENGGRIRITLDPVFISHLSSNAPMDLKEGPYLLLAVRDDGPGIAPEIIEHIFDPYFTTKPQGEGTGLGLSVVHGIVQNHGGAIQVQSKPGQGAIFKIYLPTTSHMEVADEPKIQTELGNSENILIVDDEPAIIGLLNEMLVRLKYRVTNFLDSREALAVFESDPDAFDLIITDMTMPKMTGIQLAQKMLKIRPNTRIILCTGYSKHVSKESAYALGIRAFLFKPLDFKELSVTIRGVLTDDDRPVQTDIVN